MSSSKQKIQAGVINQGQELEYRTSYLFQSFLGRILSGFVSVSYLCVSISQSFAMESDNIISHEKPAGSWSSRLPSNSVYPEVHSTNSYVLGDVELGGSGFQGNNGASLTQSDSGKSLNEDGSPKSVAKKEDEILTAQKTRILHVTDVRKVHPSLDLEQGNLQGSVDEKEDDIQSVHSEDSEESPDAIEKRNQILKNFEERASQIFGHEMSYLDWAMVIAPLVLTGVIARNEIYGEYRLIIDGVLNTFAYAPEWYSALFVDYDNKKGIDLFQDVILYNAYISLPFYLLDRVSSFSSYIGRGLTKNNLSPKIGYGMTALGMFGVIAAAVNAGAYPATMLYSAEIGFESTAPYARKLAPYLFAFYTVDSFLINSLFRDKVYKYLFVDRKDDESTRLMRQVNIKKLRTAKAVIASMTNEELLNLDLEMRGRSVEPTGEFPAISSLKHLIKISQEDQNQNRRYSVKTRSKSTETYYSAISSFFSTYWPYMIGLGLAGGGAYLSCFGSEDKFANLMQTKISTKAGMPSFNLEELGTDTVQKFILSAYHVWKDATDNVEVYNGNYTDWCWKCVNSAVFSEGSMEDGGAFIFRRCPGESYETDFTSEAGDLGYSFDQCWGLFNYIDTAKSLYVVGSTDDYYYTPPLDPLTLTSTQQKIAIAAAILYAGVNAVLAAPSTNDVIKRINDSFSNHPEEILPGKRHKLWNAATLAGAGIESLVRTAFAATAAWYVLQSTDISPSYLWTIVGLTWVSTAMNYFIPLDNAYSRIPVRIGKSVELTKSLTSKALYTLSENAHVQRMSALMPNLTGVFRSPSVMPEQIEEGNAERKQEPTFVTKLVRGLGEKAFAFNQGMTAAIICDDYIERINHMISVIENAPQDVVPVIHQEMIS